MPAKPHPAIAHRPRAATAPVRQTHLRPARAVLTVYRIAAEIFAFVTIAAISREPAPDCGTAPVRQTHPRPARAVLTLYRIAAEIFAFVTIAAISREPATDCGTAPVRRTHPRPARAVLTVYSFAAEIFAFVAIAIAIAVAAASRMPAPSYGAAPARQTHRCPACTVLTLHEIGAAPDEFGDLPLWDRIADHKQTSEQVDNAEATARRRPLLRQQAHRTGHGAHQRGRVDPLPQRRRGRGARLEREAKGIHGRSVGGDDLDRQHGLDRIERG
jgi:hypothetical protein